MLVYYDILSDKEIANDAFQSKIVVPGLLAIEGRRIQVTEGEIDIGGNPSAGGGDGDDDEDAGVDAPETRSVIDVVEAAHLQLMQLEKKEFTTLLKAYFKKLLEHLNKEKLATIGFDDDNQLPSDKAAAKAKEEEAYKAASPIEKRQYDEWQKKVDAYKANFDKVFAFIKDNILANFDECEFYSVEEGELGQCMIIPARFVGEAVAPTFYIFLDGVRQKKE